MADKTVVLNVRVNELQARWLRKLADAEHSGNLSAAARETITDSWVLRRVRDEYRSMVDHEGFSFPPSPEQGTSRGIALFLSPQWGRNISMRWDEDDVEWV